MDNRQPGAKDVLQPKDQAKDLLRKWVEQCVVGLSLCPFAAVPYRSGGVCIVVFKGGTVEEYLTTIHAELERLIDDPDKIETTLIAAETVLTDFLDFNDFLTDVEMLLQIDNRDTQFQVASFHPHYQFAGVDKDDAGNFTNRAPYPVVQWLRIESVAKAVDTMDTLAIPEANIKRLKSLGSMELRSLFPWVKR